MAQEIKLEIDDHNFTTHELKAICWIAKKYPHQSIRVNDDPTNLKVYIGPYCKELYRYWLSPDGVIGLIERDSADSDDDEAIWNSVGLKDAHDHLSLS